jgi:hypothetical protein
MCFVITQKSNLKRISSNSRLFYFGGVSSLSSPPADAIYEWIETQGWTVFSKILAPPSYQNLAVIPYNL